MDTVCCFHYSIPFLLTLSLQTTFFKLITYPLSSSAFIFLTPIFFSKLLGSGLSPQIAYIFKVFGAQSWLMVA